MVICHLISVFAETYLRKGGGGVLPGRFFTVLEVGEKREADVLNNNLCKTWSTSPHFLGSTWQATGSPYFALVFTSTWGCLRT